VIHVEVTQEDIDKGEPGDPGCCPVAMAATRAIPDGVPRVRFTKFELRTERIVLQLSSPDEVVKFVRAFDYERSSPEVRPFSFDLPDLSEPVWKAACACCRGLFDRAELDDEGFCEECRSRPNERRGKRENLQA